MVSGTEKGKPRDQEDQIPLTLRWQCMVRAQCDTNFYHTQDKSPLWPQIEAASRCPINHSGWMPLRLCRILGWWAWKGRIPSWSNSLGSNYVAFVEGASVWSLPTAWVRGLSYEHMCKKNVLGTCKFIDTEVQLWTSVDLLDIGWLSVRLIMH